jgi:hypothetical protein
LDKVEALRGLSAFAHSMLSFILDCKDSKFASFLKLLSRFLLDLLTVALLEFLEEAFEVCFLMMLPL